MLAGLTGPKQERTGLGPNGWPRCSSPWLCPVLAPSPPKPAPAPATVSAASLRRKIPRAARKAFERAARLENKGDIPGAATELESALAAAPEFAEAHIDLGVHYTRLRRYGDAAKELRRAVALMPSVSLAHSNLAWVLAMLGDREGAEQSARRAMAIARGNARAHLILGSLLRDAPEMRAEGAEHLEYAARALPEVKPLLQALQGQ